MKKLFIISAIAMSGLIYNTANAQFRIRVGVRFAPQRVYRETPVVVEQAPVVYESAPVNNYNDDDYYYLPDVDAYYSVDEQCYYYFDGDNWISAAYLPGEYRDYDWRNARRFEVREARPYLHNDVYRSRYNGSTVNAYWERRDNHSNWNREGYGNDNQRFENRSQGGYEKHDQPYRDQGNNSQRFNNGNRGGYNQQPNNRGRDNYSQPSQPNQGQSGNDQHYRNNGQNDHGQSAQPNRGQGGNYTQPSNQNNGHDQQNRGGSEHFSQNSPQGGYRTFRVNKF